ncbi:pyroglutamyl-peptidase I [Oceanobacillus manasiensis]|uniref:pyroglutamyl-peptidase I n=1 Tax=Oceanobacillus manasiensis TaxID=586413 RepID=UPI0005A9D0D7|nr:pyroglutamyl-peptidase I [Oceanobacillus manasiensis]
MKRLLLTGFEPFLDFPINPTTSIAQTLNGRQINGYEVTGEVLTVDFSKSGEQLIELMKQHKPDAVISLGLAAGRNCITPERIAINCNDGPVDNEGHKPDGEPIFSDGPDGYFSTLPIKQIVARLKEEKLPAKISNTAGAYLCNNVMYHGLHYAKQHGLNILSGFIHMPASHALAVEKSMPSWSEEDLQKAIIIAIETLP